MTCLALDAEGLVKDRQIANAIFAFTDNIPGAEVQQVIQEISMGSEQVVSKVELEIFPGLKGKVVTMAKALPSPPDVVSMTVTQTMVEDSNSFTKVIDGIPVPVQSIFERLRGEGATNVEMRIAYVDEEIRITRSLPDNEIFIYLRLRGDQLL